MQNRKYIFVLLLTLIFFTAGANASEKQQVLVALDGTGNYSSIQEAINACRPFSTDVQTIFIKNGTYREKILIDSFYTNIRLVGESADSTIILWGDYAGMPGIGTFNSYTMKIVADGVMLENLSVENSAGEVGQAVAIHVEGDKCIFVNCRILGNQDTLYAAGQKSRQYFADCYIDGTTDFIFGASIAVFDNCILHSKKNSYITAASTPQGNEFGYVFRNCKLTAKEGVSKVYLGRPWRDFSKVVFLDCEMDAHVVPEGWHNWSKPEREKTAFYAEYKSTGKGSDISGRVNWSHQLSDSEAEVFTLENIFKQENKWLPARQ